MKKPVLNIIILLFLFGSCKRGQNELIIYDAPESLTNSKFYKVTVNKRPVFVYDTKVGYDAFDLESEKFNPDSASFAYFDFSGRVNIEIESFYDKIDTVIVRPLSKGIIPKIIDNVVSFSLDSPQMLSVEINGNSTTNLMLFANEIEKSKPNPSDPNTIYFGPGIHDVDDEYGFLRLKSNQTLYIAGGAVLRARIIVEDEAYITIAGRGILDGSLLKGRWPERLREFMGEPMDVKRPGLVKFRNCKNISMSGIILMDAPMWTTTFNNCEDVHVKNTKTISYVINSDGINLVSCRNAIVEDVFVRTGDDCICIKGHFEKNHNEVSSNIIVKNSVLWADVASPLEFGHETNTSEIKDIHFANIDILQQQFKVPGYHAIDITNADNANIHDIYFQDIRIERCLRLIGIRVSKSYWMSTETRGVVENIFFDNISTLADTTVYLYGYDSTHAIRNIAFRNFYSGTKPYNPLKSLYANNFVYDLKYIDGEKTVDSFDRLLPVGMKYRTLDISPYCNRTRKDDAAGDKKGWFDLGGQNDFSALKGGEYKLGDIPFCIDNIGVIMLGSKKINYLPLGSSKIPVNQKTRFVFFLHTTTFNTSDIGTSLWTYKINYQHGKSEEFPVRSLTDVGDWELWSQAGWQYILEGKKVFIMAIQNKEENFIESIEIKSRSMDEIPVVLAITAGV